MGSRTSLPIGCLLTLTGICRVAAAQGDAASIRHAIDEYQAEIRASTPAAMDAVYTSWRARLELENASMRPDVPAQDRTRLRVTLDGLYNEMHDWKASERLSLASLDEAQTCLDRARWANYALAAMRCIAAKEGHSVDAAAAAQVAARGLAGCAPLAELANDDAVVTYAVVLHHAAAMSEPDPILRSAHLEKLEAEVASVSAANRRVDLRTDRFGLLLDGARAALRGADTIRATRLLDRIASFDDGSARSLATALATLVTDRSLPLDVRSSLLTARTAAQVGPAEIVLMLTLANEACPIGNRDRDRATLALTWINAALEPRNQAALSTADAEAIADRLQANDGPQTAADREPVTDALMILKWIVYRDALREPAAAAVTAQQILIRFPNHRLRNDLVSSAAAK
jgi:hypothetical protein